MGLFDTDLLDKVIQHETMKNAAVTQVGSDPSVSTRMDGYAQRYWWMDPGAIFSMSKAGIDPTDPTAQAAASTAAQIKNQGLGFDPIGTPVTHPGANAPSDLSGIFATLDSQKAAQQAPAPDPTQYAAGGPSPLQTFMGDTWNKLDQPTKDALNTLQLAPAESTTRSPKIEQNQPAFQLNGFDNLDPKVQEVLIRYLKDQGATFSGSAQAVDDRLNYKGQRTAVDTVYQGPPTAQFVSGPPKGSEGLGAQLMGGTNILANGLPAVGGALRTGGMVLSAPLQELTGQIRNLYELATKHDNPNWLQSQSDLGVAAGQLLSGKKVDTGNGIFVDPTSGVSMERQRRELERGNIGQEAPTLGRIAAVSGFLAYPGSIPGAYIGHQYFALQPGSKPYQLLSGLVDATLAIKADPSALALKYGSEANAASKLFTEPGSVTQAIQAYKATGEIRPALQTFTDAGGLTGIRPTVSNDAVNKFLTSPEADPLLQKLAETTDSYQVHRILGRNADPAVSAAIADASDKGEVANLLRDQLGVKIREKPDASSSLGDFASLRYRPPSRWSAMMPDAEVPSDNAMANVSQVERVGALTKMQDAVPRWFDAMARAQSPTERQGVYDQMMNDVAEKLVGKGIGADRAKTLTRLYQSAESDNSAYAVRAVGEGAGSFDQQVIVDGKPALITDNQPTMLAQTVGSNIPMPDWRALRRSLDVEPLRKVLENPAVTGAEDLLNRAQGVVWKALQVTTAKTMIKVLGDEQFAIAGRGYDSLINHPISALGMILATPLSELPEDAGFLMRLRRASTNALRWGAEQVAEPTLTSTAEGHDFSQLQEIQRIGAYGFDSALDTRGVLHADNWQPITYQPGVNDSAFANAYGRHLAQHAASPEMQAFARASSLEDAQNWYWTEGSKYRQELANSGRLGRPELLTREGSDQFVENAMRQIQTVTNGNPYLMDAIRTGKLDGTPVWVNATDGSPKINRNFISKLANYTDDFPKATIQQKAIYSADAARRQVADSMFGRGIHMLLGTPSAVLSKSPLFRQAYWERIIDNAPYLTEDAQAEVLANASKANLTPKLMKDLNGALGRSTGDVTTEMADDIAKAHGLDIVRRTTHEFSQRSQAFDMLRLLTPFGEVWRKTIQRWANIVAENPQVVRRAQQGIQAARGQDLGAFMGEPAGNGFFHTDAFGQEVFTVPGSEWATQALTGVPVPLAGSVKGLSLGTEFFPAIGPAASFPVAWTMNKLGADKADTPLGPLGEVLFPYGEPKNILDGWNYAPSWLKTAAGHDRPTSPDSIRTFNNSVIDYIRYGVTAGDYDLSTPQGVQKAIEDATNKAHELYVIRGASQFFVPGAPAPQMLLRDKGGHLVDASVLIGEYQNLSKQDPATAGQKFLDKYGPNIFEAVSPKSYGYIFGLPTSPDSAAWVDQHPDIRTNLPHTYGYFAPPSDPNNFDYNVYLDQLHRGERVPLTPEQWTKAANARLAALQYGKLRDKVDAQNGGKPPDAGQRSWLAAKKQALMDEYPGYEDSLYGGSGLPERPSPRLLVDELKAAVDDPTVQGTDAGQGLKMYLAKRAQADETWVAAGYKPGTWTQSNGADAVTLRNWLRGIGQKVIAQHQQFGPLFDDVFEREMRDDTNPASPTGA